MTQTKAAGSPEEPELPCTCCPRSLPRPSPPALPSPHSLAALILHIPVKPDPTSAARTSFWGVKRIILTQIPTSYLVCGRIPSSLGSLWPEGAEDRPLPSAVRRSGTEGAGPFLWAQPCARCAPGIDTSRGHCIPQVRFPGCRGLRRPPGPTCGGVAFSNTKGQMCKGRAASIRVCELSEPFRSRNDPRPENETDALPAKHQMGEKEK